MGGRLGSNRAGMRRNTQLQYTIAKSEYLRDNKVRIKRKNRLMKYYKTALELIEK